MKLTTGSKKADKVLDLIFKVIIVHFTILMIYSTVAVVSSPMVYKMFDSSNYDAGRLTAKGGLSDESPFICKNHYQGHLYYCDAYEKVKEIFGETLFTIMLVFVTAMAAFTSISQGVPDFSFHLLSIANYILLILVSYFVWKHQNKAPPKKRKRIITWKFLAIVLGASIAIRASFLLL